MNQVAFQRGILTKITSLLVAVMMVASPAFASAATGAGVKPGNLFYFFDIAFEKVGLFFTFTSEKRAHKTLEYADERLAEIESVSEDNNSDGVKTALANYERNMAVAAETINEVTDKGQVESLLTSIADSTSKNQKVLSAILIKVPEEAKEAIVQAIEASKKRQEEAEQQLLALKDEIEELKNEVEALKKEKETDADAPRADEFEKLKREVDELKQKQSVPVIKYSPEPKKPEPPVINIAPEQKPEAKTKTTTLPNGAVVELDARGDVVRTIKEAPEKTANDMGSDLSSQIDILKKQNAEAERQRAAQQKILEEQQKTLEQIKQNTPVTPTPIIVPTNSEPIPIPKEPLNITLEKVNYPETLKISDYPNGIPIFKTTNWTRRATNVNSTVELINAPLGLNYLNISLNGVTLKKTNIENFYISVQNGSLFPMSSTGLVTINGLPYETGNSFEYHPFQVKVNLQNVEYQIRCPDGVQYCEKSDFIYPTFPLETIITVDPH